MLENYMRFSQIFPWENFSTVLSFEVIPKVRPWPAKTFGFLENGRKIVITFTSVESIKLCVAELPERGVQADVALHVRQSLRDAQVQP
jgi:hypothetical protein